MIEIHTQIDVEDVDIDALAGAIRVACADRGIRRATVGLMIVSAEQMARINADHRGIPTPTDVLSFPIDGPDALDEWPESGPDPELGDIVICPDAAQEPLTTLAVHGLLHLLGFDHEVDAGEMLAIQDSIVGSL